MKKWILSLLNSFGFLNGTTNFVELKEKSIYDFVMKTISGKEKSLADYKGNVLIIVNTASKCGLTPQYEGLEATFKKYKDSGLRIAGFPANDFLFQEPGDEAKISEFCQINYGVSFDMYSKITVKGPQMHPLYQFLTLEKYNQLKNADVTWNFQKFLIDKTGKIRFVVSPKTKIDSPEIIAEIEKLLKE